MKSSPESPFTEEKTHAITVTIEAPYPSGTTREQLLKQLRKATNVPGVHAKGGDMEKKFIAYRISLEGPNKHQSLEKIVRRVRLNKWIISVGMNDAINVPPQMDRHKEPRQIAMEEVG
jgi:acetolactate synthase small subunit